MSNWKKYRCANKTTARMAEPYTRATLFLTYIQGGNTTEWEDRLGELAGLPNRSMQPSSHHRQ